MQIERRERKRDKRAKGDEIYLRGERDERQPKAPEATCPAECLCHPRCMVILSFLPLLSIRPTLHSTCLLFCLPVLSFPCIPCSLSPVPPTNTDPTPNTLISPPPPPCHPSPPFSLNRRVCNRPLCLSWISAHSVHCRCCCRKSIPSSRSCSRRLPRSTTRWRLRHASFGRSWQRPISPASRLCRAYARWVTHTRKTPVLRSSSMSSTPPLPTVSLVVFVCKSQAEVHMCNVLTTRDKIRDKKQKDTESRM